MSVDKVPTYAKLAGDFRTAIVAGSLSPGDALPTENELAKRYQTSRVTVRKALNTLCSEGLVESHQGKGYFVLRPEYDRYSMRFDLVRPEHEIKYDRMAVIEAPPEVRSVLSLAPGSLVVLLQLALLQDGRAVASEDKYLPYGKGVPTIESVIHYADFPELADKRLSSYKLHCELRISAELPSPEHARLLKCDKTEPLLAVRRIILSERGETVGYGVAYLREGYGHISALSGYNGGNLKTGLRNA